MNEKTASLEDHIRNEVYKLCDDEEIELNPRLRKNLVKQLRRMEKVVYLCSVRND